MESQSKACDIPIWWNGTQRWMTGLTKRTTCDDVIYALLYSSGQHEDESTDNYAIFEKWREVERPLSARTKIQKVWSFWGEEQDCVQLSMRSLDDYFRPGESNLYLHGRRRHRRLTRHKSRHERCLTCAECSRLRSLEQLVQLVVSQERKIQELNVRIQRTDRQVDTHESKIHEHRVQQDGLDYVQESYLNSHSSSSNSSIDSSTFTTIDLKKVKVIFPKSSWQDLEDIMRMCSDLTHLEHRLANEKVKAEQLTLQVETAMTEAGVTREPEMSSELEAVKVQMVRALTQAIANEHKERDLDRRAGDMQTQLTGKLTFLGHLHTQLSEMDEDTPQLNHAEVQPQRFDDVNVGDDDVTPTSKSGDDLSSGDSNLRYHTDTESSSQRPEGESIRLPEGHRRAATRPTDGVGEALPLDDRRTSPRLGPSASPSMSRVGDDVIDGDFPKARVVGNEPRSRRCRKEGSRSRSSRRSRSEERVGTSLIGLCPPGLGSQVSKDLAKAIGWDEEKGLRYSPAVLNQYNLEVSRSKATGSNSRYPSNSMTAANFSDGKTARQDKSRVNEGVARSVIQDDPCTVPPLPSPLRNRRPNIPGRKEGPCYLRPPVNSGSVKNAGTWSSNQSSNNETMQAKNSDVCLAVFEKTVKVSSFRCSGGISDDSLGATDDWQTSTRDVDAAVGAPCLKAGVPSTQMAPCLKAGVPSTQITTNGYLRAVTEREESARSQADSEEFAESVITYDAANVQSLNVVPPTKGNPSMETCHGRRLDGIDWEFPSPRVDNQLLMERMSGSCSSVSDQQISSQRMAPPNTFHSSTTSTPTSHVALATNENLAKPLSHCNNHLPAHHNNHLPAHHNNHLPAHHNSHLMAHHNNHLPAHHNNHLPAHHNSHLLAHHNNHLPAHRNNHTLVHSGNEKTVHALNQYTNAANCYNKNESQSYHHDNGNCHQDATNPTPRSSRGALYHILSDKLNKTKPVSSSKAALQPGVCPSDEPAVSSHGSSGSIQSHRPSHNNNSSSSSCSSSTVTINAISSSTETLPCAPPAPAPSDPRAEGTRARHAQSNTPNGTVSGFQRNDASLSSTKIPTTPRSTHQRPHREDGHADVAPSPKGSQQISPGPLGYNQDSATKSDAELSYRASHVDSKTSVLASGIADHMETYPSEHCDGTIVSHCHENKSVWNPSPRRFVEVSATRHRPGTGDRFQPANNIPSTQTRRQGQNRTVIPRQTSVSPSHQVFNRNNSYFSNGQMSNGHFPNGHFSSGPFSNGHLTNGHLTNGHFSNGHMSKGHCPNGHPQASVNPDALRKVCVEPVGRRRRANNPHFCDIDPAPTDAKALATDTYYNNGICLRTTTASASAGSGEEFGNRNINFAGIGDKGQRATRYTLEDSNDSDTGLGSMHSDDTANLETLV